MNQSLTPSQRTALITAAVVLLIALVLFLVYRAASGTGATMGITTGTSHFGVQTKTSGCAAHGGLPDSACTLGAVLSTGTKDAIC
jgi:hypothetical protein